MKRFAVLGCLWLLAGCSEKSHGDDDEKARGDGGSADGSTNGGEGTDDDDASVNTDPTCGPALTTDVVSVSHIDTVDILFMVDNSNSMREEQAALKAQFPKLIDTLTMGTSSIVGLASNATAKDVHLAVVTSDMGLIGVSGINGCSGFGADGVMRDPTEVGCLGGVPGQRFLSYKAGESDAAALATNFACLSDLGTGGCGFEQPLEATLKALWPKTDIDSKTGEVIVPNRVTFLADALGDGATGHGDVENKGFLRTGSAAGQSVLAIVVVTDEEDCSALNTSHFKPANQLQPTDPNYNVGLNLRCYKNPANLYDISKRYVSSYKALREGNEQLVVFAAIAGVPVDLVTAQQRAKVDFQDSAARDAYYEAILDDARMQETSDPARDPATDGNLLPSCETPNGKAYPPRRLVRLAKEMGENSVVQSICQDDFGPAMDVIVDVIKKRLGTPCLPKPVVRRANGEVECRVVWELPKASASSPDAPTECGGAFPFLKDANEYDRASLAVDAGTRLCEVEQLAVDDDDRVEVGDGWYYDDFSVERKVECAPSTPQRVAFSKGAKAPAGVNVKLVCPMDACVE